MKRTANIGYWFLLASLFVESMWLGHLTSAEYELAAVFCFVAIVFTSARGLLREPPEWWLGYLALNRFGSRLDVHKVGQLS
jgi:hypothetical protein